MYQINPNIPLVSISQSFMNVKQPIQIEPIGGNLWSDYIEKVKQKKNEDMDVFKEIDMSIFKKTCEEYFMLAKKIYKVFFY